MTDAPLIHGSDTLHSIIAEGWYASLRDKAEVIVADSLMAAVVCVMLYVAFRAITLLVKIPSLKYLNEHVQTAAHDFCAATQGKRMKSYVGVWVAVVSIGFTGIAQAQDAAAGEKVFATCRICHQIGETAKNSVGPQLNGVIGRKAGSVPGYAYSPANRDSGLTWDEATFTTYIQNPQAKVPGTKMVFPGIKDPQQIKDLIAFLKQFGADGKKG
jgi:cytochrome c